jgi:DNA-binding SARP family transcriptional activator
MADDGRGTEVRLYGPLTILVDGAPVAGRLTGTVRLLLAYLLAHPDRRHRREALIERVWDGDPTPSRSAFNTTLWRLRRFVDGVPGLVLGCNGDTLGLSLGGGARSDWQTLHSAVAAPGADGLAALDAAVAGWRGGFLEDLSADWVLAPRERAQSLYLAALVRLMHADGEAGRYEAALARAMQILDEDPFREAVHAEAMWLCVLTGQRARAITRHRAFVRLLRDELGIGPMSETTALFTYVLEGLEAPQAAASSASGPAGPYSAGQTPGAFFGLREAIQRSRADVYHALRHSFAEG